MKKRHVEYIPVQPPKKKKKKGFTLIILIIAVVLVYFYVSSNGSLKLNLPANILGNQNSTSSNPQIQQCIDNVNRCGKVIQSKYDSSVTLLQNTETNSTDEADRFLKTWGPASQNTDINFYNAGSPMILIAARFNNPDGSKTPHVFVCKADGSLAGKSTTGLC